MPVDSSETRVAVVESRLDNHEKVCSERYEAIAKSLESLSQKNDRLMWGVMGVGLMIIAYLLATFTPLGKG